MSGLFSVVGPGGPEIGGSGGNLITGSGGATTLGSGGNKILSPGGAGTLTPPIKKRARAKSSADSYDEEFNDK